MSDPRQPGSEGAGESPAGGVAATTVNQRGEAARHNTDGSGVVGPASPDQPRKGDVLGRYVLVDELGAGGMGTVFSAYDPELQRNVALKLLTSAEGGTAGSGYTLLVEGRALAQLHHPGIVPVYDVGVSEHGRFIAMKLVEGTTLAAWARTAPRSRAEILDACVLAGKALSHAHKQRVVHGDFKPSNVMVEPDGHVCVVDFGLSRSADPSTGAVGTHTATGGTPAYMAPEQHLGGPPSAVSDQFSFCVTLYELLCGERPFAGKTPTAIAQSVLEDPPARPTEQNIPTWLWRILARGLSREPEQRFASMAVLVSRLQKNPARRRAFGAAAGALCMVASVGYAMRDDPCTLDRSPMRAVWGQTQAAALDDQLGAVHAWPAIRERLDAFADAWNARWTSACTAREANSDASQLVERKLECLNEHLADFGKLTSQLRNGGVEAAERLNLAMVLDSGVACDDEAYLLQRAPRPTGPDGAEYDAVIEGVSDVFGRAHAGAPTPALWSELDGFSARAEALGHPRPRRYVQRVRAKLFSIDGRHNASADALALAFRYAEVAQDELTAMRMARSLSFLNAGFLGNVQGAVAWLDIANAKRERISSVTPEDDLILLRESARVKRKLGHPNDALERLDEALSLADEHGLYVGDLLHDRGLALHVAGRDEAALEAFAAAVSARTETMGPEHVLVGQSRFHLARALHEHGDLDAAELELERAIAVFAIHPGAVSERLVAQSSLAIFAASRGDTALAVTRQQSVIDAVTSALGEDSTRLPTMYSNLARMLMMERRHREALSAVNAAIERGGPEAETASFDQTWSLKAEIELELGRPAAALKSVDHALSVTRDEGQRTQDEVKRAWIQAQIDCDLARARATATAVLEATSEATIRKAVLTQLRNIIESWTTADLPPACSAGHDSADSARP